MGPIWATHLFFEFHDHQQRHLPGFSHYFCVTATWSKCPEPQFEVSPDDHVFVTSKKAKGLASKLSIPFRIVRIIDGGNAIIHTDDASTDELA